MTRQRFLETRQLIQQWEILLNRQSKDRKFNGEPTIYRNEKYYRVQQLEIIFQWQVDYYRRKIYYKVDNLEKIVKRWADYYTNHNHYTKVCSNQPIVTWIRNIAESSIGRK